MKRILTIATISFQLLAFQLSEAADWHRIMSLSGMWKFSIGDNMKWAGENFDDSNWDEIAVPSSWENQGYNGYDGYAWYRKYFRISTPLKNRDIVLRMGRIDDVDAVYLNGNLVGHSGSFPPQYESVYFAWREYHIPWNYFNLDKPNVIAVRVYDSQLEGGIVEGDIGLFEDEDAMPVDQYLGSEWKFSTGDNMSWKNPKFDDSNWENIFIPAYWEKQGYKDYDGFAWYRLRFKIDDNLLKGNVVLLMGKIDDIDETYINGQLVGKTGDMNKTPIRFNDNGEYQKLRTYYLPQGVLQPGENVIAVRVYDGYKDGGIYEGPIGLIEQKKFINYNRGQQRKSRSKDNRPWWEKFFDSN